MSLVDSKFDLVMAKLGASMLLTAASLFGLMAPFWFFRLVWPLVPSASLPLSARHAPSGNVDEAQLAIGGSDDDAGAHNHQHKHANGSPQQVGLNNMIAAPQHTNANIIVSIANCVSAGILLWTGLMHFFLESVSSFASPHLCPTPQLGGGLACLEHGVSRAVLCFMCGIMIPLVVEKVVWPWVTVSLGAGGGGRTSDTDSVALMMATHGQHSHSSSHHVHSVSISPCPKLSGATSTSTPAISSASQQHRRRQQAKDLTSAVLIAILMSLHSATEGIAIGVEPSTASMRGSVSPLVVHKAFDGWLVGVSVYRTCDVALRNADLFDVGRHIFFRSPQRYSLWIWLAALPLFLMTIAMAVSPAAAPEIDQTSMDYQHTTNNGHSHISATLPVAIAQATSSGSFLYVAVCAILMEELSDSSGAAAAGGSAVALATIRKHALLVASCVAGLLLGSLLSGGHE